MGLDVDVDACVGLGNEWTLLGAAGRHGAQQ